ncbi:MAG: rod-binding protein [Desulfobacterium sp.]|jgi:flagellar protein FlgJ|nr:rod-binding protein [Desulfobacterium sp.]
MEPINSINLISSPVKPAGTNTIASKEGDSQKLKQACQGFEAIFLSTMVKSMRSTLPGDALFGKSQGIEIFESMYDRELVDQLAASGNGIGIAEFLEKMQKDD